MFFTKKKQSKLALKVFNLLKSQNEKPLKSYEIALLSGLDQNSVRYALNILFKKNLIQKRRDIRDLRIIYYSFNKKLDEKLISKAIEEI